MIVSLSIQSSFVAHASDIVDPNQIYTYDIMINDIKELSSAYPDLITYKSIGTTTYGHEIWAVKLGDGDATVFFNGAHHAREWMTTTLNMYMIAQYAQAFENNEEISGYNVRDLLSKVSMWFVPMVNPDGVTLQQSGVGLFPESIRSSLINMNGGSSDFSKWKANAEGVDPNRQYDADWEHITEVSNYPNWKNYKGDSPVQTVESKSLVKFTYDTNPEIAVAYHSAGQILYWYFHNSAEVEQRDKSMAETISNMTGYSLVKPIQNPSGGGYTDWFIQEFNRPGFTPEMGDKPGEDNLPLSAFPTVWEQNKAVGTYIASEGYKLWEAKNPVKKVDTKLTVVDKIPLYDSPTMVTAYFDLLPQTVQAFEQQGKWYHIHTWLGDKWIYSKYAIVGGTQIISEEIQVDKDTIVRKIPYEQNSSIVGSISSQKLRAIEKWNNWYKVQTWLGDLWIQVK
jgi:g-D-glutamyl-meso-diaminopimelate peptidase